MGHGQRNTIWVGPEPLRRHFVDRDGDVLVIDCGEEEPDRRVDGAGLFAKPFALRGLEQIDEKTAVRLVSALDRAGQPFCGQAEKLSARQEKILGGGATVRKLSLGGTGGRRLLAEIAARLDLELGQEVVHELHDRVGHDPARAVSVLEALAAGGYRNPTVRQIALLTGTSRETGLPWTLLSQIESGDAAGARETVERSEAIPTIAFLAKRLTSAAILAEDPSLHREDLSGIVGDTSDAALAHARKISARLGGEGCLTAVVALVKADAHAKRSHGPEALALAVGQLMLLFSPQDSPETPDPGP